MGTQKLLPDSELVVKEDKVVDLIAGLAFLAAPVISLFYSSIDEILSHPKQAAFFFGLLLLSTWFFVKSQSKRVYLRINRKGIFQDEVLLTNWPNFLAAKVQDFPRTLRFSDNFKLVIEYMKEGNTNGFRRLIPLTNTQNKSEEEIMEAIRFFSAL
jgi:hypothetical protein